MPVPSATATATMVARTTYLPVADRLISASRGACGNREPASALVNELQCHVARAIVKDPTDPTRCRFVLDTVQLAR
jgi:hypothetical protein